MARRVCLTIGQSNNDTYAQGRPTKPLSAVSQKVVAWDNYVLNPSDNAASKINYQLGTRWLRVMPRTWPYHNGDGLIASSPWMAHYDAIAQQNAWLMIHQPAGSRRIGEWINAGGVAQPMLTRTVAIWQKVLATPQMANVPEEVRRVNVLDHQGHEADCNQSSNKTTFDGYAQKHRYLIEYLIAQDILSPTAVLVLTGLHPSHPGAAPAVQKPRVANFNEIVQGLVEYYNANTDLRAVYVPMGGAITPGTNHINGASQYMMGKRKYDYIKGLI